MSWLKKLFGKHKPMPTSNIDPVMEEMTAIKVAGSDNGVHYTDNVELIKQLKRDKKYDEAIEILLKSVELTEKESKKANAKPVHEDKYAFLSEGRTTTWGVAPWYYEQLAIIYRKQKRYAEEVSILERYESQPKAPGVGPMKLAERLINARELLANNNA
jgi:tetratricopeptide (TPR) repeat protein